MPPLPVAPGLLDDGVLEVGFLDVLGLFPEPGPAFGLELNHPPLLLEVVLGFLLAVELLPNQLDFLVAVVLLTLFEDLPKNPPPLFLLPPPKSPPPLFLPPPKNPPPLLPPPNPRPPPKPPNPPLLTNCIFVLFYDSNIIS